MYMNILAEKSFACSRWFDEVVEGIKLTIARKDIVINLIDDIDRIKHVSEKCGRLCIVVGASAAWIEKALNVLSIYDFRAVVVGSGISFAYGMQSVVTLDYMQSCRSAVSYMKSLGCRQIAFCGLNTDAWSDMMKYRAFIQAAGAEEQDIFVNCGSAEKCCEKCADNIENYEGLICANDYIAVTLVRFLGCKAEKIKIASFGSTAALEFVFPQVIKIVLDFKSAGQKAADAYIYLSKNDSVLCINMTVKSSMIVNGRPCVFKDGGNEKKFAENSKVDFYNDPAINKILKFEHLLCSMDELDENILELLTIKKTYEQTAEILNTSVATIKYRIKKIMASCGFDERKDMAALYGEFFRLRMKSK